MSKRVTYFKNSYNDPKASLLLSLLFTVAAIALAMRAIDTGSWQQYGLAFASAIFAINRFAHTVIYLVKGRVKRV